MNKRRGLVRQVKRLERNDVKVLDNIKKEQEGIMKRTIKDSVFTDLFQDKKYLLQLYKALHPEDTDVTEDDLTDITIKNVLTDNIYNDLGFTVGDKLMILVEAQSSVWTVNIIVRALMYLVQTWHDYFERTKQNLYKSKKVQMPMPEIYVIFTGERKTRPSEISLSQEFFGGKDCAVDVKVKMIYNGKEGDIINQYVMFTKVCNEQMKKYGRSRKAVMEAIRICKDRDVLREYLSNRESEVVSIMMVLYDEEEIMRSYVESERHDEKIETAKRLLQMQKLTNDDIAAGSGLTIEEVEKLADELQLV
ncbi:MAG: hypothetical protein HFI03_17160 [Lachnospiraceae bacterium]|jgi:hypothetical protein|nr:hypothetical protein [Lachnospiraceae bacterium]